MVMAYALPLALFVGVFGAGREDLLTDIPLLVFFLIAFLSSVISTVRPLIFPSRLAASSW
jgi:hypothetical protein